MCGIFAYLGEREATNILLNGLRRLEYRGYDSAGITIQSETLKTIKAKGRINVLADKVRKENLKGTIGIAHTRWATHGEPTTINAHPHQSCNQEISIVHNGVIENYQEIKTLLQKEGHIFKSETDTEVIAHLIEKFYKGNLAKAIQQAVSLLEGAYGIAVVSNEKEEIVGAKKGSPIILGIGKNEYFLSSDISAIADHTKKIITLEDNDIVTINKKGYSIKNLGETTNRQEEEIEWNIEELEKKGYKHFMLKEINEQSETIANALRGRIEEANANTHLGLDLTEKQIKGFERIILLACGTSWHASLVGKYLLEQTLNIPVEVDYASEFRYRKPLVKETDLVIAISQSGETADTLAALKEAKRLGATTMGIVNVVGSAIAREAERGVYLHAGPEIGVASTKAFTSQITVLHLLAVYFGRTRNSLTKEQAKKIIDELKTLPDKVAETLKLNSKIKQIASKYQDANNFLYLGRGINFPVALEGALKLKEISYIHAEGYPAAEMKHGPIALIDEKMPVVFIANKSTDTYEKVLANMEEVKARKGRIITIATEPDARIEKLSQHIIYVPKTSEKMTPIINTIPLQLLAYHLAVMKGNDVDRPRNLAKSVTVE